MSVGNVAYQYYSLSIYSEQNTLRGEGVGGTEMRSSHRRPETGWDWNRTGGWREGGKISGMGSSEQKI